MVVYCLCKEREFSVSSVVLFVSSIWRSFIMGSSPYQCLGLRTGKKKGNYSFRKYIVSFLCMKDFLMNSSLLQSAFLNI